MASIMAKSRDHARTPMQWDGSKNAGFTEGEPWLAVNPNYKTVNAAEAQDDPDSILNFYKKLIRLRKQYADIIKGSYKLLLPDDPQLFVYERQANGQKLMSISNVSKEEAAFYWPDGSEPERPSCFSATMIMTAARNPASHSAHTKQEFICLPDM